MSDCVVALTKIATLSKSVTESQKHVNSLPELIQYLQEDDDTVVKAAIAALDNVYSHFAAQGDLSWMLRPPKAEGRSHDDVLYEYSCWRREVCGSCRDQLLCLLLHPQHSIASAALDLLLKMVGWEGHASPPGTYSFPNSLFHPVVTRLLENTSDGEALISHCAEAWLGHHDVLFHWLKNIASVVNNKLDEKQKMVSGIREHFVENVYATLRVVAMPTEGGALDRFLAGSPSQVTGDSAKIAKSASKGVRTLQRYRKHFSDAWLAFLRLPLPPRLLRQALVDLHSAVMPHLQDPRLLLDFLSSAYSYGGVVSLLALNGLFILMNKYHLDYPTFYPKLYQLLDASIFHVKYMARFLRLLNTFLSSTHLSLYLVAAFIKKLARLSLSAPPDGVVLAVVMVTNLVKRHPNTRVLLHRTNTEDFSLTCDPYDLHEPNPAESHALESSLWELKTQQSHYSPAVAKVVCQLTKPDSLTSRLEANLEHHLRSLDRYKVAAFETGFKGEVALNFKHPTSLWQH